ncbi:MAG: CoA ester lyase [Chloroflexi bacterium]|nr:CoA ester lyase [Chloroflexota bacterium]
MRSILTVPVIVERFLQKAPSSGADVICLDVEDSVPPAEKERARTLAADAIQSLSAAPGALFVRVNGPATGLLEDDLSGIVRPGLDGVVVSMTDSADAVRQVDEQLTGLERKHTIPSGSIAIIPLVETARGVVKCLEICEASPRVAAAIFGAEDFATDMGIARTAEGGEISWARNQVAVHCHAAGVVPIDTPDPDYTDEAHLEKEMSSARSLGYRGKLCIHPVQVALANRIFAPSSEEVEEAKTVVDLFEREGLAKGLAAIPADGRMIDTPIYWRAKHLLEWAESAEA